MGRASRQKRQRHARRTWQTVNPWTGAHERFQVCVSDEALREWEHHRVRLAAAGYPDRPPEFDSPNLRAWSTVPGTPIRFDPAAAADTEIRLGADPEARVVGTWRSSTGELGAKVTVGRRDDGTFTLDLVLETLTWHSSQALRVADAEEARRVIESLDTTMLRAHGLPPLTFTSADAFAAELADAA